MPLDVKNTSVVVAVVVVDVVVDVAVVPVVAAVAVVAVVAVVVAVPPPIANTHQQKTNSLSVGMLFAKSHWTLCKKPS